MLESAPELDVLVVAPHPDDAEISVGGTIIRCREQGLTVGVVDLTSGEPTPHGTLPIRENETRKATECLGINWRYNLGLPNRSLEPSLENRRALAAVFRLTRPKFVFAPFWEDAHPDHVAASQLCDDARFWSKLSRSDIPGIPYWPPRMLYFWSIHLRIHPQPQLAIDISAQIEAKMAAVACYESQLITGRPTTHPTILDDIKDRSRYWGWTIHVGYAEPFAMRETVGLHQLTDLGQIS